jgi:hypothetical protein
MEKILNHRAVGVHHFQTNISETSLRNLKSPMERIQNTEPTKKRCELNE